MAHLSKLFEILPDKYGYVLVVACSSFLVNAWMARQVANAREQYNVPCPVMYSGETDGVNLFNCIQRAHQDTLENQTQFLFLLMVAGLHDPRRAAFAGITYIVGCIVYAHGYYSGNPDSRRPGSAICTSDLATLFCGVIAFAACQLGWYKTTAATSPVTPVK